MSQQPRNATCQGTRTKMTKKTSAIERRAVVGRRRVVSSLRLYRVICNGSNAHETNERSHLPNILRTRCIGQSRTDNSHHITQTNPNVTGNRSTASGANCGLPRFPSQIPTRNGNRETKYDARTRYGSLLRAKKSKEDLTSGIGAFRRHELLR